MRKIIGFFLLLSALTAFMSCSHRDRYITITGFAQGGTYAVKLNLNGVDVKPEEIRDSVDAILVNIDNSISGYNRKSLLSRFNAGEPVVPDRIFRDIYELAYVIFDISWGLFSASSGLLCILIH